MDKAENDGGRGVWGDRSEGEGEEGKGEERVERKAESWGGEVVVIGRGLSIDDGVRRFSVRLECQRLERIADTKWADPTKRKSLREAEVVRCQPIQEGHGRCLVASQYSFPL